MQDRGYMMGVGLREDKGGIRKQVHRKALTRDAQHKSDAVERFAFYFPMNGRSLWKEVAEKHSCGARRLVRRVGWQC